MQANSLSDIGLVRKINEDSYLVKESIGLFVVADGMGGHKGGQLASTIAIQTIDDFFNEDNDHAQKGSYLSLALNIANRRIFEAASKGENLGMGTTVTGIKIINSKAYIAHIGDSRAYLIRNNNIELITNDHSLVGELMRNGELSEKEALTHPHRNILIRALGTEPEVEIDLLEIDLQVDDILLLCTDGLSNHVDKEEMLNIVQGYNIKEAVNLLVKVALDRGGTDNITVVLVNYDG